MKTDFNDACRNFFSSTRERRLWVWVAVSVLGIYSTLGLAATLADIVYNQPLITVAFFGCMVLLLVTILTQGLKTRLGGVEIGVALGILLVYFMLFLRMAIPERSHLIEYGVVAVLIHEALTERAAQGRFVPFPALLAIGAASLVGAVDESIQLILPSRHFEWTDIVFNTLASVMAVVSMVILSWARRLARYWAR